MLLLQGNSEVHKLIKTCVLIYSYKNALLHIGALYIILHYFRVDDCIIMYNTYKCIIYISHINFTVVFFRFRNMYEFGPYIIVFK